MIYYNCKHFLFVDGYVLTFTYNLHCLSPQFLYTTTIMCLCHKLAFLNQERKKTEAFQNKLCGLSHLPRSFLHLWKKNTHKKNMHFSIYFLSFSHFNRPFLLFSGRQITILGQHVVLETTVPSATFYTNFGMDRNINKVHFSPYS